MNREIIFDLKILIEDHNWATDISGKQIGWSKIRQVFVTYENPHSVYFKTEVNSPFNTMKTIKNTGCPRNFANFELKQAYISKLKIPAAKVKDLLCLCKKGLRGRDSFSLS